MFIKQIILLMYLVPDVLELYKKIYVIYFVNILKIIQMVL